MDKEMYFKLFNKIADVIEELKKLQCEMEEAYIEGESVAAEQSFAREICSASK